jgi:hypothetical protein
MGFPRWPLWHVVLLALALVMAAGPRRILAHAAAGLMLLFAALVPLVLVAAIRSDFFGLEPPLFGMMLSLFGIMLIPAYLLWCLCDELRAKPR